MKMKYYFGASTARKLGEQLGIDGDSFAEWVAPRVDDLEISARVGVFAEGLRDRLPADYLDALAVIVPRLGPELAEGEGYFNHAFHLWPVSRFIENYGLDHPEASLDAIVALTRAFTGEWAVRPFLARYPSLTMERVLQWSCSESHNVRRLATEGIRPRLPWSPLHRPFIDDPRPIIPVLDRLYCDPSAFVRTSVANNLNGISRTHPELALETAERWSGEAPPAVIERGLRTLVKQGNQVALALVGYGAASEVSVGAVEFPGRASIGASAPLRLELHNSSAETVNVMVDYRLYFLKKNGQRRPTTFKLGKFALAAGETRQLEKLHTFRVTGTRTYYPGAHAVSVVVNGVESPQREFTLS